MATRESTALTPYGQGGWRVGFPAALGTRYQYDGGWGYESGLVTLFGEDDTLPPVTLQHAGWRWYQPSIGRFVQRDPIGLEGGLNVYAYVQNAPLRRIDPSGLQQVATPWGPSFPTAVPDALPMPPDTPGVDFGYGPPAPRSVTEACWMASRQAGGPPLGEHQFDPPPPLPCPHGCFRGECRGHLEPGFPSPPTPPNNGGIPAIPVLAGTALLMAGAAWRRGRHEDGP